MKRFLKWLFRYFNLNKRYEEAYPSEVISQIIHPPETDGGMCACKDACIDTENNRWIEYAHLVGGHHTNFVIGNCRKCNGVIGFPPSNLILFLKEGVQPTLDDFKKTFDITKDFNNEN